MFQASGRSSALRGPLFGTLRESGTRNWGAHFLALEPRRDDHTGMQVHQKPKN